MDILVEEHVTSFDPEKNEESMNFIEAFLKEINNPQNNSSVFSQQNGYKHLTATLISLFMAGGDTVSDEATFAFMRLAYHLDWQDTIWREIQLHVGTTRVPTLDDRKKMPKTQAFIYEILRLHPIAPFIAHKAYDECSFENLVVPKGTFVVANMFGIHHNPEFWPEPEEFKPERFLSAGQYELIRSENLIPFSSEQKKCLGQQNALDLLFLYVTHVIQRFDLKFVPNSEIDLEPQFHFTLSAKPYKIILEKRNA